MGEACTWNSESSSPPIWYTPKDKFPIHLIWLDEIPTSVLGESGIPADVVMMPFRRICNRWVLIDLPVK